MNHLTTTATELHRLMHCIGSRNMARSYPEVQDDEARREGNCADWLAVELFEGRQVAVGARAPNGWIVTDDMMDHVREYLGALDCGAVQVDTSFEGSGFDVRGRADHVVHRAHRLTVDDLKYGYRLVSPEWNWTLLAHAIGYCIRAQIQPERIILRIHQPRAYHPDGPLREWSLSYGELMECYNRIVATLGSPSNELRTGLDVCAKCHALATCPAAREAEMNAWDALKYSVFDDALDNNQIAHQFELSRAAQMFSKNRMDAIEELITYRVQNGESFSANGRSARLKPRLGQRTWNKGLTGAALSACTGVDLRKDATVTPAEAERRGVSKDVITQLTNRPNIGTKLEWVDVDAETRRVFGD